MTRYLRIVAGLVLLVLPIVAAAQGVAIPPEANWTRYPSAQKMVDVGQLTELPITKGVITPQEAAQLTHPQEGRRDRPGEKIAGERRASYLSTP
jgi:hypothetical protein